MSLRVKKLLLVFFSRSRSVNAPDPEGAGLPGLIPARDPGRALQRTARERSLLTQSGIHHSSSSGMTDPSRGTTFKRRQIAGTFLQPSPEHPTPLFSPHPAPLGAALRSHRAANAEIHHRLGMLQRLFLRTLSGTRRVFCCYSSQQLVVRLPVNRTSCLTATCAASAKLLTWWCCHAPSPPATRTRGICFSCSSKPGLSQSRDLTQRKGHQAEHRGGAPDAQSRDAAQKAGMCPERGCRPKPGCCPERRQQRSAGCAHPAGLRAKPGSCRSGSCRSSQPAISADPLPQRDKSLRPWDRAARSHGSQPKQVIWLAAHAVCPEGPSAAAPAHLPFHSTAGRTGTTESRLRTGSGPGRGLGILGIQGLHPPSIHPTSFQHCKLLPDLLPSSQNTPKGLRLTKFCCASKAVMLQSRTTEILHPMEPAKGHICHFPRRRSSPPKFRVSQLSAMKPLFYF